MICEPDFYRFRCEITHRVDHQESTRAIGHHLHDGVILLLRPESFSFFRSSLNLVIPERFKEITALICTRKQNLKDSGRSNKMTSSCKWPIDFMYIVAPRCG